MKYKGFVVDKQPPSPGSVYIGNHGDAGVQYAVDQFLHISWSACSDDTAGEETGYVDGIAGYSVAIGKKHEYSEPVYVHRGTTEKHSPC